MRPADKMVMVYVPEGEFEMGSTAGDADEQPIHSVGLAGFWIDRTEVTNLQYRRCVEAGRCDGPTWCVWGEPTYGDPSKDLHPVVCADWFGAEAYCAWAGGRLPTEAEWEYAARGPDGLKYPWGDDAPNTTLLNYDDNVTEVGSYPMGASWCGALDMAGNVWEWVADWEGEYPSERQVNPTGPASGDLRGLRGGSSGGTPHSWRGATRNGVPPDVPLDFIGFRCAKDAGRLSEQRDD